MIYLITEIAKSLLSLAVIVIIISAVAMAF
jgi:hypothetical protein